MINIDFINYKTIICYLIIFSAVLVGGLIAKDGFTLLIITIILFFAIIQNRFRTIEAYFIWLFVYDFFTSQGLITISFIEFYIAKPSNLLLIAFILFAKRIPLKILTEKYIIIWGMFLFLIFLNSIIKLQSPFDIIPISSFFMVYLVLQVKGITPFQYQSLLNLFIAAAIIQTVVSSLQLLEIIPTPTLIMEDGQGGLTEWVPTLNDVASGTFGSTGSHLTSWYTALISLLLMLIWSVTKKMSYFFFVAIILLQSALIDSKTIMGVTALMLSYMLFYLFKQKKMFKINIRRYILFLVVIVACTLGFVKLWNAFYEFSAEQTGGDRTELSAVYNNEVASSVDLVLDSIGEWGKIRGYQYVFEDFIKNDPKQIIWGYGIRGYTINGKMGYIESKDTPVMQLNNSTNSRSGLITLFAKVGLLGFIFFFISVSQWVNYNNCKVVNNFDLIKISLLKIFLPFTLLAAFLYAFDFNSITFIAFTAIISIYAKLSDNDRLNKLLRIEQLKSIEPISR